MPEAVAKSRSPQRTGRWLYVVAIVSFLSAVYLLITPGGGNNVRSIDTNTFSRSALGHRGLLQLLHEIGEPVIRQRSRLPIPAGLLVFAEPDKNEGSFDVNQLADAMDEADDSLVVLPKRYPADLMTTKKWVDETKLYSIPAVQKVMARMPMVWEPDVRRVDEVRTWRTFDGLPAPVIPGPVQLIAHGDLVKPLIECREGVLLGYLDDRYSTWVLSDPDLFANHGLLRGDNAELAVAILRRLRGEGAIAFDETTHGFAQEPSVFHLAREFPVNIVTAHLLLLLAVVAFAARGRFGAVEPPPVAIASGKEFLIENVVALQQYAGHDETSLMRYARMSVRRAAVRLRAPRGLDFEQSLDWLQRRIPDANTRDELTRLCRWQKTPGAKRNVVATARRIQELTNRIGNAS